MQSCVIRHNFTRQDQSHEARLIVGENSEEEPPPAVGSDLMSPEHLAAAFEEKLNCCNIPASCKPAHNPYYCLHPNIEMKRNHLGKGLYAKAPIREGEVIYDATKSTTLARVDAKTMAAWPVEQFDFFEKYSWQVGHDVWSGPSCKQDLKNDYVNYLNHSCDPTAWFQGEEALIARRDIQPGEEITFDYATSETAVSTFLIAGCLCGSPKCRMRVSPWDYKLPSLQAKYGEHFMPYVLEKIATEPKLQLGSGMYSSLHQHTELRKSKSGGFRGCGLFATDFIPKGSIVWCGENDNDALATAEEFDTFSKDKKEWFLNFSHQVDKDTISSVRCLEDLEKDAAHFMNHSCDPTLWFVGDKLLEARRDIYPGEELTYDYGTNDSLFERITNCKCGAAECRGKVTTRDYLLPYMQERYKHHISLYLLAELFATQAKVAADMVEDF